MKIKSITDVITNSSSECFLIKTEKSRKEVLKELKNKERFGENHSSGMGGVLEVFDKSTEIEDFEWFTDYCEEEIKHTPFEFLPKDYLAIHVDKGYEDLINFIKTEYEFVEDIFDDNSPVFNKIFETYYKKEEEEILKRMGEVDDRKIVNLWPRYKKIQEKLNFIKNEN